MFVTTSAKQGSKQVCEANEISIELKIPYIKRNNKSISSLFHENNATSAIIVTSDTWKYQDVFGNIFFFHPSLSVLRINKLRNGIADSLITIAKIKPGDMVLDCTLGIGADSIVSSFAVGMDGGVVALESEPIIAVIVNHGLQTYATDLKEIDEGMRTIRVINKNYMDYLKQAPDKSFDIILFDPMFRNTCHTSNTMQSVKLLANPIPVSVEAIQEAKRVARKTIVLKERSTSSEFQRLGFIVRKRSSNVALGVIDVGGSE